MLIVFQHINYMNVTLQGIFEAENSNSDQSRYKEQKIYFRNTKNLCTHIINSYSGEFFFFVYNIVINYVHML